MKTNAALSILAAIAFLPFSAFGQQLPDTTDFNVDMLQVPNSPAFSLMDLAPTSIDEPKVPTDFAVSLRQATDSFTTWPKSYAIEFAPAWVFGRDKIDFSKFSSNSLGNNIWQSLTISAGINHLADPSSPANNDRSTQLGLGLKFSLLRGEMEEKHQTMDSLYQTMAAVNSSMFTNLQAWFKEDPTWKSWDDSVKIYSKAPINVSRLQVAGDQRATRENALMADTTKFRQQVLSKFSLQLNALQAQSAGLKMNRRGFKLDFASGFVTDFYNQSIEGAQITRGGAWLTGAWVFKPTESQLNTSILGVLRVLGNPKQLYRVADSGDTLSADNLFFDFGGRLILHNGKRFSLSAELLGRVPINNDGLKSTSRYVVNVDYQLTKVITLSFNIGKNFNGTVNEGGNLVTALQMFTALGKRSYNNGKML